MWLREQFAKHGSRSKLCVVSRHLKNEGGEEETYIAAPKADSAELRRLVQTMIQTNLLKVIGKLRKTSAVTLAVYVDVVSA